MPTRPSHRRLLLRAALLSTLIAISHGGAPASVAARQQTGAQAWSGTVTVTRQASGTFRPDDGKAWLGFAGSETVTFQLGPDGTASYIATFRNSYNHAGEYSVPTSGHGTGNAYWDIGFNGVSWDVSIEGAGDFPTETDYTAQDLWWANEFRGLVELGQALSGGQAPEAYNGRLEKGSRGTGGAAFAAQGSASAKSLSGTHTERPPSSGPEGLEGLPAIPMTLTVSWNLTLGPVQPKIAIRGPDCGCLDAAAPESTQLTFLAGTTAPGGEFSEFEVVPDGKAPEVVVNDGGAQPRLILTGTRETEGVTLKIHYTKDGKRYDAPPRRVEFCTVNDIHLKDGTRDVAFDGNGELAVNAWSRAWHNGEEVSGEIAWDLEKMGSPTTLAANPESRKAEAIQFKYAGLPQSNDSFGPRTLSASVVRGKCSCRKQETIRAFFNGADDLHPGDKAPNWFYYWSQTSAVTSAARSQLAFQEQIVDANLPEARPIAKYDPESGRLLVSSALYVKNGCRPMTADGGEGSRRNQGIDCFAETVRHEWQHRQDAIDWWGTPGGPYRISLPEWFALDWDHDQVPNRIEDAERGCKYGSHPAVTPAGGRETWFTCARRPFPDTTDAEINAYSVGWTWPTGTVDKVDWSCGSLGKQWRGKTCGN